MIVVIALHCHFGGLLHSGFFFLFGQTVSWVIHLKFKVFVTLFFGPTVCLVEFFFWCNSFIIVLGIFCYFVLIAKSSLFLLPNLFAQTFFLVSKIFK